MEKDKISAITPDDPFANFPGEREHLQGINEMINLEMKTAENTVAQLEDEQRELQEYMVSQRGEGSAMDMFQNEQMMRNIEDTGSSAVAELERLKKVKNSPYFARIDFTPNTGDALSYYIGLYAFRHEKKLHIIDWRSPVGSMFYDFDTGPAYYITPQTLESPAEQIDGQMTLRRQFKIKDGQLEFAFDSSQNIQDDILQQELAHTSDEKMKSIISTIQKEQNKIIRDEKAKVMIIQGVAGSGKTSIALHRVAFLLYRFRDTIKAQNITIISPNKVFGDYISGVLPELGEEPIFEASLEELALIQIEDGVDFTGDKNPLEYDDPAWTERVRFKGTAEFVHLMDEFIENMPTTIFAVEDYNFGEFNVPAEWIQERINIYKRFPMLQKLEQVADDIHSRLLNEFLREEVPPNRTKIYQSLRKMLKCKTTLQAYKEFYRQIGQPKMYKPFKKGVLEWNDVFPFLYLQSYFTGIQQSHLIKHLVIDEMQDYTPIQYALLNRMFNKCTKTILGDFGQSINPNCRYTLEELQALYPESVLMRLEKSYRSTYEIIHFAKKIASANDFEAMERHGDKPQLFAFDTEQEELEKIAEAVREFHAGDYNAMGILTRTNPEAEILCQKLCEIGADVNLITPESKSFSNGATVMSIQMSKGLEFDEVLIPTATKDEYHTDFDKNLLYVACTRAMHRLNLTCFGTPTPLIDEALSL